MPLARLLRRDAAPAGHIVRCPVCGDYYETSSPAESYPHNNH